MPLAHSPALHEFLSRNSTPSDDPASHPLLSSSHRNSQSSCQPDSKKILVLASFVLFILVFGGWIWYMFIKHSYSDPFADVALPPNCTCVEEHAQSSCWESDAFQQNACVPEQEVCSDGVHVPELLCPEDCSVPCKINLNVCEENNCANGGVCQAIDNDRVCQCSYGFNGNHCQDHVDPDVCGDTLSRSGDIVASISATSSCHCASLCDLLSDCHQWQFQAGTAASCSLHKASSEGAQAGSAGIKSGTKGCGGLSANHTGVPIMQLTSDDACSCKGICYDHRDCFGWTWSRGNCILKRHGSLTEDGWTNGVLSGHRDLNCHPIINFREVTDGVDDFPVTEIQEIMGQQCSQMCSLDEPQFQCISLTNSSFQCTNKGHDKTTAQLVSYQYVLDPNQDVSQFCCSCHRHSACRFLECSAEKPGACLTCRTSGATGLAPLLLIAIVLIQL